MRQSTISCKEEVLRADELIKAGTPFICFDLETTGVSTVSDRPISISAIKIAMQNGLPEEVGRMDLLLNPGFRIPKEASDINHIYDEDVQDAPKEEEVFKDIKLFFGEKPFLCGYNSKTFDINFLNALYGREGEEFSPIMHIDVYQMAKEMLELKSYKLEAVAHELGVDAGLLFHTSIDDCLATFRCFTILLKDYTVPDEKPTVQRVAVKGVTYWHGPSHTLERIYVQTDPYSKTYYDCYRKEWKSDLDIDLDALKKDTFAGCKVKSEADMVRTVKASSNSTVQ